eukprot:6322640-Heterocapsa_arctica.AAC.1
MKHAEREIESETFLTWYVGVLKFLSEGGCEAKPSHTIPMNNSGNVTGCAIVPLPDHRHPFRLAEKLHVAAW